MERTGNSFFLLFVACSAHGWSPVSGQDLDQDLDKVSGSADVSPAIAADYASIIRFSRSADPGVPSTVPAVSTTNAARGTPEEVELAEAALSAAHAGSSLRATAVQPRVGPAPTAATTSLLTTSPEAPSGSSVNAAGKVVEEMRRRSERAPPSQGMRKSEHVEQWEIPETWSLGSAEVEWPQWVFEGTDLYIDEAPDYAEIEPLPLFYVQPPRETELKRKVTKVVRNKLFREVRRHVKRRWRKLFKDSPTMTFNTYEEMLAKINNIGKSGDEVDVFNEDYNVNDAKDQIFRKESRHGEAEIPLFSWGPLTVTDAGSIRFDMGTAASAEEEDVVVETVELGGKKAKPLFSGREYKLSTSLQMSVNGDYTGGENFMPFLSSYGLEMEVEWLSDILGREMVGAEFEVEFDDDGDVAAFFNFVIKSR